MAEIFEAHLKKFINLEKGTFEDILSYFECMDVRKKEYLMKEGDFCNFHFFVEEGCIRKFFIKENGTEQTTEFALEQWWMTDNFAFERSLQTSFYIQAVEPSAIVKISNESREALLKAHPIMERYYRFIYQRAYAAAERRIRFLYEYSSEELYLHFKEHFPEFIHRIPQHLIASYLGFTPEYLSELRRKHLS